MQLTKAGAPTSGTDEVQRVSLTGGAFEGTFTLSFGGQETDPIPYNATAAQVQAALEALSSIGARNVVCSGGPLPGTPVVITFAGNLGGLPQDEMTVDGDEIAGAAPAVAIATPTAGVAGTLQVETATVVGAITAGGDAEVIVTAVGMANSPKAIPVAVAGIPQVETATVVGAIEPAGAGDADVIITAAGMTGSPKTLNVAVANDDTAAQVAGKIRAALELDEDVTAMFAVSGAGAEVILTKLAPAANDATLNIDINNGTCAGLTDAPTSADTTAGVAPDDAEAVAGKIRTALGLDEDVDDFFTISGSGADIILTAKTKAANDATMNVSIDNDTCVGLTAAPTSANTTPGVAPVNEVQSVSLTGGPTGGTFTLTYSGQTTAAIAYNANAAAVQAALEALSNIDPGDVVCSGGPLPGAAVLVTFQGQLAATNVSAMTGSAASLTEPGTAIETITPGVRGDYRGVAPGEVLIDTTNRIIYQNVGTRWCPTWSELPMI